MIVSVINQKGGTGKTTTAIHLSIALARKGFPTLLIDNDPQGSVKVSLQLQDAHLKKALLDPSLFSESLETIERNLDVIAGDYSMLEIEKALHSGEQTISKLYAFSEVFSRYQYVIFDMAPSQSLLNESALWQADEILVPVSCDYLALVGVRDILNFAESVGLKRNRRIELKGVVPTFFDKRNNIAKESVQMLSQHFPEKVFDPIRQSTKAKEAPSFGKSVFDYAPLSTVASDYLKLSDQFLH